MVTETNLRFLTHCPLLGSLSDPKNYCAKNLSILIISQTLHETYIRPFAFHRRRQVRWRRSVFNNRNAAAKEIEIIQRLFLVIAMDCQVVQASSMNH